MAKTCAICGKPSGMYPLCPACFKLRDAGEVLKCDSCGAWHRKGEPCQCKTPEPVVQPKNKAAEPVKEPASASSDELACILCGEPSNGKHFCISCYHKYKDKVVYIQVKKCAEFSKLEAEYESDLTCDDGHMVKSPYEKIIDNWLYSEGIKHAYEAKLDIDETHDITPDFYIPEYNGIKNIYIEFWGYGDSNAKYQKIKEYKMKIYPELVKRDNIAVIYLSKAEVDNDSYKKKIKYAIQGQIKK